MAEPIPDFTADDHYAATRIPLKRLMHRHSAPEREIQRLCGLSLSAVVVMGDGGRVGL